MDLYTYNTFLGPLTIVANEEYVTHIFFHQKFKIKHARHYESNLIRKTFLQICEYFDGRRDTFDVPLRLLETNHGEKVRKIVETIPYGKSLTYQEIAELLVSPNSHRATGISIRTSRIVIVIPFHRAIGISGRAKGYEEETRINDELLRLERRYLNLFR